MVPYEKMCDYLDESFPEFVASKECDVENKDLPYVFYGSFSNLVERWLKDKNEPLIDKFFIFINRFYQEAEIGSEQENLVAVELFEGFLVEEYFNLFTSKLKGKAKETYLKMYNWKP